MKRADPHLRTDLKSQTVASEAANTCKSSSLASTHPFGTDCCITLAGDRKWQEGARVQTCRLSETGLAESINTNTTPIYVYSSAVNMLSPSTYNFWTAELLPSAYVGAQQFLLQYRASASIAGSLCHVLHSAAMLSVGCGCVDGNVQLSDSRAVGGLQLRSTTATAMLSESCLCAPTPCQRSSLRSKHSQPPTLRRRPHLTLKVWQKKVPAPNTTY